MYGLREGVDGVTKALAEASPAARGLPGATPASGALGPYSLSAALLAKSATLVSTGSSVYWWNRHFAWMRGLPAET
ncbi:hypothetical protein STENM327S_03362 [Streptomyces tendae]